MNVLKKNIITTSIFSILFTIAMDTRSQEISDVKNWIEAQNYIFVPQTVLPAGGGSRQLNPEYSVKISKEAVISDLPYFGRVYSAPLGKNDGGIKFTSNKFDYSKKVRRKGGWDIMIKPKDASEVQQLSFTISENGNASLRVISSNRQSIAYNGYIKAE